MEIKLYSRVLHNFAYSKFVLNSNYNPIPEFHKALKIRLKEKDNWGLNSSFAHLSDYYKKHGLILHYSTPERCMTLQKI
jgi:hypothetical protein